jgi:hypothetical protein
MAFHRRWGSDVLGAVERALTVVALAWLASLW